MKNTSALANKASQELLAIIQKKEAELQNKDAEIKALREKLQLALARQFGKKSEKVPGDDQLNLFDEPEVSTQAEDIEAVDNDISVPAHTRKKGGRKPLPEYLPRIDKVHDLEDDEKVCPCGCELTRMGEAVSEQLDYIPAQVHVIRNIRLKYACPECEETIKLAALPKMPIPKSIATPGLLSQVLVSKYHDHLPLYRQEAIFQRHGIALSRGTLSNWVIKCSQLLLPLVKLMVDEIIGYDIASADETTLQVLKEKDRPPDKKSYMWLYHGGPPDKHAFVYEYKSSRASEVPLEFFRGFKGYLQTDGYSGYRALASKPGVTAVGCWAHARRKFVDVTKVANRGGFAQQAIRKIGALYKIEKEMKARAFTSEQVYEKRQKESKTLLEAFHAGLTANLPQAAPKSKLAEAIGYALNQWPALIAYLQDGRLEIDNNTSERAIKPFVIGRKNWMFSNSMQGAEASAAIFSLMETCKAHKVNPYHYFRYVLGEIVHAKTIEQLETLLPYNIDSVLIKKL